VALRVLVEELPNYSLKQAPSLIVSKKNVKLLVKGQFLKIKILPEFAHKSSLI